MSKYKTGDKVVIRKDLVVGEDYGKWDWSSAMNPLADKDYVTIKDSDSSGSYDIEEDCYIITNEMIQCLYAEDKKYVWHLDDGEGTYFLNNVLGVDKWYSDEMNETKNGKDIYYLLTEEEAKQSPFFDKFQKHDPFEKWYYIRVKGSEGYLNLDTNNNVLYAYFAYSNALCSYKYEFTEEECNEIIGTSSILYKEECRND